ncbi:hypothetical protein ABC977_09590 [Thioalkalicoccus limnaeus]|uniref:Uncharacterized protein n=1 Tax=Thioalkalicoccus limnaeus TaxID=120681 RepID=A0ABV4BH49_9GAMM
MLQIMKRMSSRWFLLLFGMLVALAIGREAWPASLDPAEVPDALQPWIPWVLDEPDERLCPRRDDGQALCAWPGQLHLEIDRDGGRFAQRWHLLADAWVTLPGDAAAWPQSVTVEGTLHPVVEQDGRPALWLAAGDHELAGAFDWPRRPPGLALSPSTAVVALHLDGIAVPTPRIDADGRLWLAAEPAEVVVDPERPAIDADRLTLDVVRRIDDQIPLRVTTRLELEVAGAAREIQLGPVALAGGLPLRLESPLPARLEDRGRLVVQARPGRWTLTLETQHPGPVTALPLDGRPAPWPDHEVWVFAADPGLRQVEIQGADTIDPRQTRLPPDWQRLPAYRMQPGMTLELVPLRRGAVGEDRLRLTRDLWLDFAGGGVSLRDRISGELRTSWRLDAEPPLALGQVTVDGEPRLITRQPGAAGSEAPSGVEVRAGQLELLADGRLAPISIGLTARVPASGWDLTFDSVAMRLHLPPGWDLLAAEGVDNLPDSWVARWSLLDLFMVLIAALAVARLWGVGWGLLALAALVLTWTEPQAPRTLWLHGLAAVALLRVLPHEATRPALARLRALVRFYALVVALLFAAVTLPFLVTEMRDGLFPQLDRPDGRADLVTLVRDQLAEDAVRDGAMASPAADRARSVFATVPSAAPKILPRLDPDARVQTGFGVPAWQWRAFDLQFNGPVMAGQEARLWLRPPVAALPLAILQVLLVLALALRIASGMRRAPPAGGSGSGRDRLAAATLSTAVLLMLAGLLVTIVPSEVRAESASIEVSAMAHREAPPLPTGAFPPPELLGDLRQRLLAPPRCWPSCATLTRMDLRVSATGLDLELVIDAAAASAVPIPGHVEGWYPTRIDRNGTPVDGLRREAGGTLLVPVPPGRHRLRLTGPLPASGQVELPLPLRPKRVTAAVGADWRIEGLDRDGRPGEQLRLLRRSAEPASQEPAVTTGREDAPQALSPLLRVTRTLRLGIDWTVTTEVERLSPTGTSISLRVPLWSGESVITPAREIDGDGLLVSLPPERVRDGWVATLEPVERLRLEATTDPHLVEAWRIEADPLWHLTTSGFPPMQNPAGVDRWPPVWRPWPGEHLILSVTRPVATPGPTLTLDRSRYELNPGRRATDARLVLTLRSSQGGSHRLHLPEQAELTEVLIDRQPRVLLFRDGVLELPLVPGTQQVEIAWREPIGLDWLYRPSVVNLGAVGVNAETRVTPAPDRWVLWVSGSGLGPAVQFWALLPVLALLALVLARWRQTPLTAADWFLLGVGLSQAGIWVALLVVLWLFALAWRRQVAADIPPWRFNLIQIGLVGLTIAALVGLLVAVQQGLLGHPAMQIAGNDSTARVLNWYLDRGLAESATPTLISAPIWIYRVLMLVWALWLAWRLLQWLRWGWEGFAAPVLWRESRRRDKDPSSRGAAPDGSRTRDP